MKRQPDGTWRSPRQPVVVSAATLRARWIEAEVIALRVKGFFLEDIAGHISRVGRGLEKPVTPLPDNVVFEPNYSISRQACHKAFNKAIAREPSHRTKELRVLYTMRCESLYLSLEPLARQGDPRAAAVRLKIVEFEAKINNCMPATRANKSIPQEDNSDEPAKSSLEDAARYLDLFTGAVKILVDLGVPLPQIQPPSIETTATRVQEPADVPDPESA